MDGAGSVFGFDRVGDQGPGNEELLILGDEGETLWLAFAGQNDEVNLILFGN